MKDYFRNIAFTPRARPDVVRLTDPAVMRALAHPLRIRLLWHLLEVDSATATECSEVVGDSPSSCSYHLRKLAEAGLLKDAAGEDRRERRWQLAMRGFDLASETPEQRSAALAVSEELLRQDAAVMRAFMKAFETYSAAWRKAAGDWRSTVHLTADELRTIADGYRAVVEPFVARERRGERPEGSERVHLVWIGVPWRVGSP